MLVTNLIGRRSSVWGEDLLNRIPVVRTVYGGVKSFAESVLSQSNSFRKVVMVEYPRSGRLEHRLSDRRGRPGGGAQAR